MVDKFVLSYFKFKSNVIRKRDKEIVEKEREVWDAIQESNRLRLKSDTLQQQTYKISFFFFQNAFKMTYFIFHFSNQ
jgi:hypothetical protein